MKPQPYRRIAAGTLTIAAGMFAAAGWLIPGTVRDIAHAQGAAPAPAPEARAPLCTPRPGMLGVSRVVEIDTSRGPRFGLQQYHEHDFLRDNEVVLTFDDGPLRKHTRMVLEALAAHCTQATFYMVGQMALADPEMVREVGRAGHTVGIHTWSHRNLRAAGTANAQREIELGISSVQRALGRPVAPFFRFPYLADSQAMLAHLSERNFGVFSIDVDSKDFRTRNPKEMQRAVMSVLAQKRKGILLFHDIQFSTANGIRSVMDDLASRGFRVVHLVPKAEAKSVASFDAIAEAEHARRHKLAAANPMAQRSLVYPLTPPGVPIDHYRPSAAPVPGNAVARGALPRPPATPAAAAGGPVQPIPAAAPQIPPQPGQLSAPAAASGDPRPALRGTDTDDDWKRKVFGQ